MGSHLAAGKTKTGSVGDLWSVRCTKAGDGRALPVEMSCGLVDEKISLHTCESSCLSVPGSTLGWCPGATVLNSQCHFPSPGFPPGINAATEPVVCWRTWMSTAFRAGSPERQAHTGRQTRHSCDQPLRPVPVSSSIRWRV